jgi:hypothetical protein
MKLKSKKNLGFLATFVCLSLLFAGTAPSLSENLRYKSKESSSDLSTAKRNPNSKSSDYFFRIFQNYFSIFSKSLNSQQNLHENFDKASLLKDLGKLFSVACYELSKGFQLAKTLNWDYDSEDFTIDENLFSKVNSIILSIRLTLAIKLYKLGYTVNCCFLAVSFLPRASI